VRRATVLALAGGAATMHDEGTLDVVGEDETTNVPFGLGSMRRESLTACASTRVTARR
jgi:hypothetical protein